MANLEICLIRKREAVKKAREEYHSFMRVRKLEDINSSYNLTAIMLRLEKNLTHAVLSVELDEMILSIEDRRKAK